MISELALLLLPTPSGDESKVEDKFQTIWNQSVD